VKGDAVSGLSDARFLTVAEVADMMRVSRMTVYRLVHSGDLPAIRFGRSFRVPESAVQMAMSNHVVEPTISRSA
jgi:excisionase family DNA binding protein